MPDLMDDISMPSVQSASPSAPTSQKENQSAENNTAEFTDASTGFGKIYGKDDYKGAPIRFERELPVGGFGKTFDSGAGEVRIPQGYVPAPDGFGAMYDSGAGKGQKAPMAAAEKAAGNDAALKEMFSVKPEQEKNAESAKTAESGMAAIELKKAEEPKPAENKTVELAKAPQTAEKPKEEKPAAEKAEEPKPAENKAAEANGKRPHRKGKTVKVKARAVHLKAVEAKAENVIEKPAENKAPEQPKAEEKKPVELAKKPEQSKEMAATEPSKAEKETAKPAENKASEQPKAEEKKPVELVKKPEQPKEMAATEPPKAEKEAAKPVENKAPEQPKAEEKKPVELAKKPEQPKEMAAIELSKAEKETAKPAENKAAEQPKAEDKKPVELAKKPEQPKEMAAIDPPKSEKETAKPAENKAPKQPKAEEKKPVELAKKPEQPKEMAAIDPPKAEKETAKPAENKAPEQPKAEDKKPAELAKKPAENKAAETEKPQQKPVVPPPPVKPAPMNNIPVQPGFGNIPPQNGGNNPNGVQNPLGGAAFIGSIDDINKYVGNGTAQSPGETQSLKGVQSLSETETSSVNTINKVESSETPITDIARDILAAVVGTIPGFLLWIVFGKATMGLSAVNIFLNIIMFVCPLLMAAGSLFSYHFVNRSRFINTKRCALICMIVLAVMIYLANRTVTCMQIVDICNNMKDYVAKISGLLGFSSSDIDAIWDEDMTKEAMREMTGFTKINFGKCFFNFSDIL